MNDIQTQAHCVWAYDRCDIIRIYHDRPPLFPPFTFLFLIIRWFYRYYGYLSAKDKTREMLFPRFSKISFVFFYVFINFFCNQK